MKKAIIAAAALGLCLPGYTQEKYVVSANVALQANNIDEAKENIDKAFENAETREKPKALFVRGEIYMQMEQNNMVFLQTKGTQGTEKYKELMPYKEGTTAFVKLVETKPDYEKEIVAQSLYFSTSLYFNDGVTELKAKNYEKALEDFKVVKKICALDGGKEFADKSRFGKIDTISANADMLIANADYFQEKYDDAIPLLEKVVKNPATANPTEYNVLVEAMNKQKKTTEAFAYIEEGRKLFPDDVNLRYEELNYYNQTGKQDELLKKLEDAHKSDPNNADVTYNLATTYLNMLNGKQKPANADELSKKCEDAFNQCLKTSPDNLGYNYNFGAFYFNEAKEVNDQMNGLPDAEVDKYNSMKTSRDAKFNLALPYFEKAYNVGQANSASLKGDDLRNYKSTLTALNQIYNIQSKADKAKEMSDKLKAMQ